MSRQAVGGATYRLHVLLLLFLHFKFLLFFLLSSYMSIIVINPKCGNYYGLDISKKILA